MTEIQSVRRANAILLDVSTASEGLTAKEVASRNSLNITTCYHLLNTLTADRLLYKGADGRFRLGESAWVLARCIENARTCPPAYVEALHRLAALTGEAAYISVWRRNEIEILETVNGIHPVTVADLTPGYFQHPHARASCKVLFAHIPDERLTAHINGIVFTPLARNTITDPDAFREEIDKVRRQGFAIDDEEYAEGVVCLSAPVVARGIVVAALTISMPRERYVGQEDAVLQKLLKVAADLT